ncbi:anion permease [Ectobacillus sp. sgz5001026]|uniref:inorganic phosphate transporter n=1 Tax=Ectobacillus sp. sgz5001026 TaxID=3242473 RepID=UPI0036D2F224
MSTLFVLTIFIVLGAILFDFINGFHDTANAVATAVSTKALTPRQAITLAAFMNIIGALSFTGVAKTISSGIVDPFKLQNGSLVIIAALLAAICWNLITWYFGIPSSSSHAIIGAIAGSAIVASGVHAVNFKGFLKIIESLIISPILAYALGYIVFLIIKLIFRNLDLMKTNRRFRYVQIVTAALQAYTHGTNDAQKSMGIITLALLTGGYISTDNIPLWVQLSCAIAMGLGTFVGGWRIIKTVGSKLMKIRPVHGVAADITGASIIFTATMIHLPVSTTHVISSAVLGVGSSQRMKGVQWKTAQRIIITWFITLPLSAFLAAALYYVLHMLISL